MQQVESWRLEELVMLLDDLSAVLKAGRHPEWACVFDHFGHELTLLREAKTSGPTELRRLVRNIRLCFEGNSGFLQLIFDGPDDGPASALNLRLSRLKSRIAEALEEIGLRLVERVN